MFPDADPWDKLVFVLVAVVIVNRKHMLGREGAVVDVLMPAAPHGEEQGGRAMTATRVIPPRRAWQPSPPPTPAWRWLRLLWTDRHLALAAAVGIPVVIGLLVGVVMPRGPVTTVQALAVMLAGGIVGLATGVALRSRWAMVLAPVVHVAAFELARLGAEGPTVDRVGVTGMAFLALILGRGVHGLGADGSTLPGSIAELGTVKLGGERFDETSRILTTLVLPETYPVD